jgi:hypothetical protein
MLGDPAVRFVSVPPEVALDCVVQVAAPVVDVAVAPAFVPPFLLPYVIVRVLPCAREMGETVIV